MRPISSITSASRCTSPSRQYGTPTSSRRAVAAHAEAEPREDRLDLVTGIAAPSSRSHALDAQRHRARLGRARVDVDRLAHHPRAAELHHQPRREPLRGHRELGVELLLEARARLAAQRERLHRARDVGPDPGGRLHRHARRLLRHLRDLAAHDPRRGWSGPSASETTAISAVELALDVVERRHPLARLRAVHAHPPAAHLVEVERVHRLAGEQHHVVGDVDDVRDRPLPGRDQARLEPQRRRPDLHVLEHAHGEAQADLRVAISTDAGPRPCRTRRLGVLVGGVGASGASVSACSSRAMP